MTETTAPTRAEILHRAVLSEYDLVVIGGGVNGCAIALQAAHAGLAVVLLEKDDYGWATSAWNSRLIHGGLKYLEHADIRLVRESLREREWLLHAAPHLVKPLRFMLPFYRRNSHSAAILRLGMVAYDALSIDKSLPRHRVHDREATLRLAPGLDEDGLLGSASYSDGQVERAERLTIELALAAQSAGAVMLNHAQVDQVLGDSGRVTGVAVTDTLTGTMHRVSARAVVNAAGPWVDEVLQGGRATERRPLMGGTKGTHIVVDPFPGAPVGVALYYEAVTDARPMMVIPWLGQYLIGATDVRFTGDLNAATNDRDEIDYILRETNLVLPHAGLTTREVRWAWTGVRPLPYHPSGPTGDITRRHLVKRHESDADLRLAGLYSVIGGKLTTFRSVAVDTVNTVIRDAGLGRRHDRPLRRLPGAQVADFSSFRSSYLAGSASPSEVRHRLVDLYGTRALQVEALAEHRPELKRAVGETPGLTAAEVLFVAERESAATVSDVVARRILTGLGKDFGLTDVDAVAEVLIRNARWNEDAVAEQVAAYGRYVRRFEMRAAPA